MKEKGPLKDCHPPYGVLYELPYQFRSGYLGAKYCSPNRGNLGIIHVLEALGHGAANRRSRKLAEVALSGSIVSHNSKQNIEALKQKPNAATRLCEMSGPLMSATADTKMLQSLLTHTYIYMYTICI